MPPLSLYPIIVGDRYSPSANRDDMVANEGHPMLGLAMQDKRIMQAIQACPEGVSIEEWGPLQAEVVTFIQAFMNSGNNSEAVRARGLDVLDLVCFYGGGVCANMPNPFINHGGPLVAPSLFFLRSKNAEPVLDDLAQVVGQQTGSGRNLSAVALGAELTTKLIRTAAPKYGACTLPRISSEDYAAQQVGRRAMPAAMLVVGIVVLLVIVLVAQ